jgi:hypothetical protein
MNLTGAGFENGVDCSVKTTFPDSAVNTVGMFFNGRTSRVDVSIHNMEPQKITVNFIGGYFQDIATLKPVVNVCPQHSPIPLVGKAEVDCS